MNMHMEDHEAGTSTTDTSAIENELEAPFPPAFDSFAWVVIGCQQQ